MTRRGKVALVVFLIALFAAVGIATYVTLDLLFPREPEAEQFDFQVCRPEHAIMPEDLGRTDIPPPPVVCK